MQFLIGLACAAVISTLAYACRALTAGGTSAAVVLGTVIFGFGGLPWAAVLLAFFLSSSLLTRAFHTKKAGLKGVFEKSSRRDGWQVLANGGVAGLLVLLHALFPRTDWVWVAYCASLAAVNADTWATELGVISGEQPVLITNSRTVPKGTSGGVTRSGLLASAGGALLVGLLAVLFWQGERPLLVGQSAISLGAVAFAGIAGSLVDSWVGAMLQGIYYCPSCRQETEHHPVHACGRPTRHMRGLAWVNNDLVNLLCSVSAAFLGGIIIQVLFSTW